MLILGFVVLVVAVFVNSNPLIFGRKVDTHGFDVTTEQAVLDSQLALVRDALGQDYDKYRNHCLRVYTFTKFFLTEQVMEDIPKALDILAVALAYHDVALWTDGALDYLDPSVKQMDSHVAKEEEPILNQEELEIAGIIIEEHHKVTSYTAGKNESVNALVNAARKADWADATVGIVRFGLPSGLLETAYERIPELGFHMMLAKMGSRLSPDSFVGQLAVFRIFKW